MEKMPVMKIYLKDLQAITKDPQAITKLAEAAEGFFAGSAELRIYQQDGIWVIENGVKALILEDDSEEVEEKPICECCLFPAYDDEGCETLCRRCVEDGVECGCEICEDRGKGGML